MNELYEEAAREWIARQIRKRGHKHTRAEVRKPEFGIDHGWPGTDVTPGDEDSAALMCEIKQGGKWIEHGEPVYSVSGFLRECSEIVRELDRTSPEGLIRQQLDDATAARAQAEERARRAESRLERIKRAVGGGE